jgi:chaperonin GroEL (HSP60 family)
MAGRDEKKGIKETRELLNAILGPKGLAVLLTRVFKDGFQTSDLVEIMTTLSIDPIFRDAISGIQKLPEEVKDIDLMEGIELAEIALRAIPAIIKEAKT